MSVGKYTGLMSRVFANGPVGWGSIPRRVLPKSQKMVPDAALLKTQHYKVQIKGKVNRSKEWSSSLTYTSGHPRQRSPTFFIS